MEKIKYESPKFEFQEMRLMERVADKCWGEAEANYTVIYNNGTPEDTSDDIPIPFNEIFSDTINGCQGQNAATAINEWAQSNSVSLQVGTNDGNTKNENFNVLKS